MKGDGPRLAMAGALLSFLLIVHASTGQQLGFVRTAVIGTNEFGLVVAPGTNDGWVSLQSSSDLQTWTEIASLATTNDTALYVDEVNVQSGARFYRLKQPGTSVDAAQARWPPGSGLAYRFHLEKVSVNTSPWVIEGTVTVTNGLKLVSDATADGQPLDQPDPKEFPSVEELFAALKAAQKAGCRVVYAIYDPSLGFPARCVIDQRGKAVPPANPGNALVYRISSLEFLPGSRRSSASPRLTESAHSQNVLHP